MYATCAFPTIGKKRCSQVEYNVISFQQAFPIVLLFSNVEALGLFFGFNPLKSSLT